VRSGVLKEVSLPRLRASLSRQRYPDCARQFRHAKAPPCLVRLDRFCSVLSPSRVEQTLPDLGPSLASIFHTSEQAMSQLRANILNGRSTLVMGQAGIIAAAGQIQKLISGGILPA